MTHDSQVIELLGRNLLVAELLQAGLEVALPIRDRGLDGRQVEVQTLIGRTLPRVVETFLDYLLNHLRSQ